MANPGDNRIAGADAHHDPPDLEEGVNAIEGAGDQEVMQQLGVAQNDATANKKKKWIASAVAAIRETYILPEMKKYYTEMAGVLVPLSTFAAGITLASQFIITCPGSRLEALLALASQLFLATPVVMLAVYVLLYGRQETDKVLDTHINVLVIGQFIVAAVALGAAFVIVGVAIYVAQIGDYKIGIGGLVLLSLVVLMTLISGCVGPFFRHLPIEEQTRHGEASGSDRSRNPIRPGHIALIGVQLCAVVVLLVLGGISSSEACVTYGCTANATTDPIERMKASACLQSKYIANPT